MRFTPTPIPGAVLIDLEPHADERGFFARSLCVDEFREHGLDGRMVQQSLSWNPRRGTLRGLHFQAEPHAEDKLVRVTRGAIFDVIVDLRADSATRGHWFGVELSADNRRQIYIPRGLAHGFQTTEDDTEVFYQMSQSYAPEFAAGVRWNDPAFGIEWPLAPSTMSDRDRSYPDFTL